MAPLIRLIKSLLPMVPFVLCTAMHATSMFDYSNVNSYIISLPTSSGGRAFKVCNTNSSGNETCVSYPQMKWEKYGFNGASQQWANYFNRCGNFDDQNMLAAIGQSAGITIGVWSYGFFKAIIAGLSFQFAISDPMAPYPETNIYDIDAIASGFQFVMDKNEDQSLKQAAYQVDAIAKKFLFLLQPKDSQIVVPPQTIDLMSNVLQFCSWQFDEYLKLKIQYRCMSGCHNFDLNK
jgi:hypothetical protein